MLKKREKTNTLKYVFLSEVKFPGSRGQKHMWPRPIIEPSAAFCCLSPVTILSTPYHCPPKKTLHSHSFETSLTEHQHAQKTLTRCSSEVYRRSNEGENRLIDQRTKPYINKDGRFPKGGFITRFIVIQVKFLTD